MFERVAIAGTLGLLIGSVGAVAVSSLMKRSRPQAFVLAMDRVRGSSRASQLLGHIHVEHGMPTLTGDMGERFASFTFDVHGDKAKGTVQVAAKRGGAALGATGSSEDEWRLLKLRVRVGRHKVDLIR